MPVDDTNSGAGPLVGLLIVDLTRVLAGPFATMMMADLGARVVKVERPERGDDSRAYGPFRSGRSLYFDRVNRGKESIALNLADPADRAVLLGLVDRADVLVENFRPGVMGRLGLGYPELAARNPRLVYASISGFGQTGPWRQRPAYDTVVQAAAGLMAITGAPDGPPTKPGTSIADLAAGLYAFGAVMAALHGRDRTGSGTQVDVAMFDAAVSLLEGAALQYLTHRAEPPRIGNAHYTISPFGTFGCADRPIVICAAHDGLFGVLCTVLGRPGLVTDPRFASNEGRTRHRDALVAELEAALRAEPAAHWLDLLGAAGVPCGPVSGVGEALDSDQVAARRMVIEAGGQPMPGNPMKISGYPDPVIRPPAPSLDQHGPALRAEIAGATAAPPAVQPAG
ncbi:MAG TPA: CoA transferase [Mycobacteriales bacterium]|nr:CoA transferase [Mycobacteriales bacterium]